MKLSEIRPCYACGGGMSQSHSVLDGAFKMNVQHEPKLFTTVRYEIGDNTVRTVYGFKITDGEAKLHFVERFYRQSSTAKTWKVDEVYHATFMTKMPDDLVIPDDVWKRVQAYRVGFLVDLMGGQ